MLFDPNAHEPLLDADWSPDDGRAAIRTIAQDADASLRDCDWWPVHPLDREGDTPDVVHGIYFGAAGVLWALDHLARAGLHEPGHEYGRLAREALASYNERPEFGGPVTSLWVGEGGIALVAWLLEPEPALADRLAELVAVDPDGDTLELLWGSPGQLLIADVMLERTGEDRWRTAWSALAEHLLDSFGAEVEGYWMQHLYGQRRVWLGAGHGMAGIADTLARRPELLAHEELVRRVLPAAAATAIREGDLATWPPALDDALRHTSGTIRTQWCHGAPGMVASLASLPRDPELDALLLAGGELTWAAGPLRKGAGLCHGTAGNGFAFLKLFARTGDERWLERARRFATHAAAQVEASRSEYGRGRHSLWTGDLGSAIFLEQCLAGGDVLPALDAW
jgi:hypothetical protein